MPEPITYGERFFSADGTEINIGASGAVFHDATFANRTQGGFDAVTFIVGRFVGLVNAHAVDADGVDVDYKELLSDGSTALRFLLSAEVSRRIAAVTLNYFPEVGSFQFFSVEFWKPSAATDPGTGGSSASGIVLAGSVDPHAGWGAGDLRGFQSGPQQIVSAGGSAQSPLSQWFVRESARSFTTAGATIGTDDTTDPGSTASTWNFTTTAGSKVSVVHLSYLDTGSGSRSWRFRVDVTGGPTEYLGMHFSGITGQDDVELDVTGGGPNEFAYPVALEDHIVWSLVAQNNDGSLQFQQAAQGSYDASFNHTIAGLIA